ncbi:MAG: polysaccharide deacetylase family protein [Bryobacterales bacterium]|nr:polysaccharide deacetylase family protein [Bryobacterales bacterium]
MSGVWAGAAAPGWLTAGLAGAAVVGAAAWAVRGRSSQVFGPSLWRGHPARPRVALTFDDGPSPATEAILDLLQEFSARATFFQIGQAALGSPALARRVSAAGHEIGNHTLSHAALYAKTPAGVYGEVSGAQRVLQEIHGGAPRWFRAPYGCRWFGLRDALRDHGLTGVMWSCLGLDWKRPARSVAARVIAHAGNGSIICLHDGRAGQPGADCRVTVEALRLILPALRQRQLELVTLSEVFR